MFPNFNPSILQSHPMKAHLFFLLSIVLFYFSGFISAQTDFTSRLVNPSFETGNYNGWTWTGRTGGWTTVNNDGDATKHGTFIGGYWNSTIADVECFQTITGLPVGFYQVQALATISTGRTTNQRLFANNQSVLYASPSHPAYTAANVALMTTNESLTFAGHAESTAENGPFLPMRVLVHITDGTLRTGFKFSGRASAQGFQFNHTTRADAGFFKFDHFTLTEVSDVATLQSISLSGGMFNEAFSPGRFHYTVTIPEGITTVTPVVVPAVMGVAITGVHPVTLNQGSGSSTITVTALNGTTQRIYTIQYQSALPTTGAQQDKLYRDHFPLGHVALLESPLKRAMDLNGQHLLKYNVDRLLAPYRKEAGLPAKTVSYPNWIQLDGHIGGHYLSAMAIHFAATGDTVFQRIMNYMVDELRACQVANTTQFPLWGKGYVGGVPSSANVWSNFRNGNLTPFNNAWVPWYNLHKTYAGLRDAWLYGNNALAKQAFLEFCDWGMAITSQLTDAQMESMLQIEHGGMNEIFADAFQMTGNNQYLLAAQRFSHRFLLNSMAGGVDNLDNLHANTQIPKVIGFQRIAEVSKDPAYQRASRFFWQSVIANRTLSSGGNSRRELFPPLSSSIELIQDIEGPESCNTHNMMKLAGNLFRISPHAELADYYERALFNHILSTQHPQHGGYVYFTPARPQHYRVYSAPNQAMWCCVGTGMENHGKYGEFIYTHRQDSLFVNLFIASHLTWKEKGVELIQTTQFPEEDKTKITVKADAPVKFCMNIRSPYWVKEGALVIKVNGVVWNEGSVPASYIAIDRIWSEGDVVEIHLPMHIRIESIPRVPQYVAFMYGPILLGAKTDTSDLVGLVADDSRWGHIASGPQRPLDQAPILISERDSIAANIVKVEGEKLQFRIKNVLVAPKDTALVLKPFYQIHDARYMMYWLTLTRNQYQSYLDSLSVVEQAEMALELRTVDRVATGEQQPEVDHKMVTSNSFSGIHMNEYWRDARNGGFFSYEMQTANQNNLSLWVRYWGNEVGSRSFNILVDEQIVATENIVGKWNRNEFVAVEYPIPNALVEGKPMITVKFQGINANNMAGGVFFLRLLKPALPASTPSLHDSASGVYVQGSEGKLWVGGMKSPSSIWVYDYSGRIVHQQQTSNADLWIPMQFKGVFIVSVQNSEGVSRFKTWVP